MAQEGHAKSHASFLRQHGEASGEGYLYRGRGLIQLTGKSNYSEFTKFYNKTFNNNTDFVSHPELLGINRHYAMISALHYFQIHTIPLINRGMSFNIITKSINSGLSDVKKRHEVYNAALKLFNK